MKAESKAVKKGEAPDYTKCDEKFADKWTKVETKGEGLCITEGDGLGVGLAIQDCLANVSAGLAGGTFAGDAYWFLGELGQDCDEVCAGHGLAYDDATETYAGSVASGGSAPNCQSVINALPLPPDGPCDTNRNTTVNILGSPLDIGCGWLGSDNCADFVAVYNWNSIYFSGGVPTTSTGSSADFARACACQ